MTSFNVALLRLLFVLRKAFVRTPRSLSVDSGDGVIGASAFSRREFWIDTQRGRACTLLLYYS